MVLALVCSADRFGGKESPVPLSVEVTGWTFGGMKSTGLNSKSNLAM